MENLRIKARKAAGRVLVDGFFRGAAWAGRLNPIAIPAVHHVGVTRDIPYTDSGRVEHLLDVYRPTNRPGPYPIVLYLHGGSFRILSKDSHWLMGLIFARRGYVVFNANYRLAPANRFPAAVEDACAVYEWVLEHAEEYGGDPSRLLVAGESAGANLSVVVTLACCYQRPEPHASRVYARCRVPDVVLPACGMYQVTNPQRFACSARRPRWVMDRLEEVSSAYLPAGIGTEALDLADPVVLVERGDEPDRPLPPFFLGVGTRDPLEDDTRRLAAALRELGVDVEDRYYEGEMHAFHAFVFRAKARQYWRDTFAFVEAHARPCR